MASPFVRSVIAVSTASLLVVAAVVLLSNSGGSSTSSEIAPTEELEAVTFCWRKAHSYGRGRGRTERRCEKTYGSGNCEKALLLWYQKCRSGYSPFGCCLCRKKPPVPPGWVNCGLGAAVDRSTCSTRIKDQVLSVFKAIAKIGGLIASGGTSAAAAEATEAANSATEAFEAFSDPTSVLADASDDEDVKTVQKMAEKAKAYGDALNDAVQSSNTAQAKRAIEEAAGVVDPTGLADVAAAFTYPDCSPSFGSR